MNTYEVKVYARDGVTMLDRPAVKEREQGA
jgi:hypothetical protein